MIVGEPMITFVILYVCDKCEVISALPGPCIACGNYLTSAYFERKQMPPLRRLARFIRIKLGIK